MRRPKECKGCSGWHNPTEECKYHLHDHSHTHTHTHAHTHTHPSKVQQITTFSVSFYHSLASFASIFLSGSLLNSTPRPHLTLRPLNRAANRTATVPTQWGRGGIRVAHESAPNQVEREKKKKTHYFRRLGFTEPQSLGSAPAVVGDSSYTSLIWSGYEPRHF